MPQNPHVYLTTLYGKTVLRVNGTTDQVERWNQVRSEWIVDTKENHLESLKFGVSKLDDIGLASVAEFVNKQLQIRADAEAKRKSV